MQKRPFNGCAGGENASGKLKKFGSLMVFCLAGIIFESCQACRIGVRSIPGLQNYRGAVAGAPPQRTRPRSHCDVSNDLPGVSETSGKRHEPDWNAWAIKSGERTRWRAIFGGLPKILSYSFFLPAPAGESGERWFGRAAQTGTRAASAPNEREMESFSGRMVRPEWFGVQLDPKLALLGKGKLHKPDFDFCSGDYP